MVHVKDSAGPPDHRIVEVGAGKIDFKKIFAQSEQAGIKHYFVEHDEPVDAFASIRASCEYLKRLELVRSEEHTSELQSRLHLVCRLLLEKKKKTKNMQPLLD